MDTSHQIRVVAGVFSRGDRVLACRRSPDRAAGGRWEFPGGKIEDGEPPQAALQRELVEELDVRVTVGELLDRSSTPVGPMIIDLACYLIEDQDPDPTTSTDHDQLRWQPITALAELDWAEPDQPAVDLIVARHRLPTGTIRGG